MRHCPVHAIFVPLVFCILLGEIYAKEENEEKIEIQEQLDPFMAQRLQYPYGNGLGNSQPFGQGLGGEMVNFDFQCKCNAKTMSNNANAPTDSNQASQQQIQQLNEQVRRLQEQLRRQQQGASAFEQFAQMLSMADGLDCNCSGSSSPLSNTHQGPSASPGMTGFNPLMQQNRYGGMQFAQRMSPSMIPQLQGPMFPMKS